MALAERNTLKLCPKRFPRDVREELNEVLTIFTGIYSLRHFAFSLWIKADKEVFFFTAKIMWLEVRKLCLKQKGMNNKIIKLQLKE